MPNSEAIKSVDCSNCNQSLVAANERKGANWFRCSHCGQIQPFDLDDGTKGLRRLSIWSLILGMASIVFGLFTGIPAILLGLKRTRKRTSPFRQNRDYYLAIFGIFTGGVFGLVSGCCVFTVVGVIVLVRTTSTSTFDPQQIRSDLAAIADVELPNALAPQISRKIVGIRIIGYSTRVRKALGNDKFRVITPETAELEFGFFPIQSSINEVSFIEGKKTDTLGNSGEIKVDDTQEIEWSIAGESRKVTLILGSNKDEKKFRKYLAIFTHGGAVYTLYAGTLDEENSEKRPTLTETQIKAIFESFQPKRKEDGTY